MLLPRGITKQNQLFDCCLLPVTYKGLSEDSPLIHAHFALTWPRFMKKLTM